MHPPDKRVVVYVHRNQTHRVYSNGRLAATAAAEPSHNALSCRVRSQRCAYGDIIII